MLAVACNRHVQGEQATGTIRRCQPQDGLKQHYQDEQGKQHTRVGQNATVFLLQGSVCREVEVPIYYSRMVLAFQGSDFLANATRLHWENYSS